MAGDRISQVETQYVNLAVYQIWESITLIADFFYPRYEYYIMIDYEQIITN